MGVAPLTITLNDLPVYFLLPVPVPLCSAGLEVLEPKEGMFSPTHMTMIPQSRKLRLPLGHIVFLIPLIHHAKKEVTVIPLYPWGIPSKTCSGYLKPWSVPNPKYIVLSFLLCIYTFSLKGSILRLLFGVSELTESLLLLCFGAIR